MTVEIDGANNIIKTNTISEVTSANGVTVDGLSIKDSKLVTANSVVEANITNGAVTSGKIASGVIPTSRPNANPLIINGDMAVAQRSTSVTGIGNGDEGYHTIDRFKFEEGQTPTAVWTMTQESLTSGNAYNAGFTKALKMDCTTSDNASGHGDILNVMKYATERQDTHLFKKGTSSAEKYTVAFWFKATKTGTHICELRDFANDRAVSVAYTVSSSNTWEHKVLVFPADTTGAIGTGNSKGLEIYWCLYSGSGYQSASLQTAWGSSATNKRYTGQVNNADSTSNNWHITGLQLEVGEYTSATLPPFQHESFGDNLFRCQRYLNRMVQNGSGSNIRFATGICTSSTATEIAYLCFPEMRSTPALTLPAADKFRIRSSTAEACSSINADNRHKNGVNIQANVSSGLTSGNGANFDARSNDAFVELDAEL
tara:strand:+ start:149 stop:1432 length:1284 start_codon:yes stop_codon:yes gene_type:complete